MPSAFLLLQYLGILTQNTFSVLYCIVLYRTVPYHTLPDRTGPDRTHRAVSRRVVSCRVVSCRVVSYCHRTMTSNLARVDTRYLSIELAPTRPLYALYNIRGFTPDKSCKNFLHAQTIASAMLFESRTTILATVQHNWLCISWLYIGSTKEFHVKG